MSNLSLAPAWLSSTKFSSSKQVEPKKVEIKVGKCSVPKSRYKTNKVPFKAHLVTYSTATSNKVKPSFVGEKFDKNFPSLCDNVSKCDDNNNNTTAQRIKSSPEINLSSSTCSAANSSNAANSAWTSKRAVTLDNVRIVKENRATSPISTSGSDYSDDFEIKQARNLIPRPIQYNNKKKRRNYNNNNKNYNKNYKSNNYYGSSNTSFNHHHHHHHAGSSTSRAVSVEVLSSPKKARSDCSLATSFRNAKSNYRTSNNNINNATYESRYNGFSNGGSSSSTKRNKSYEHSKTTRPTTTNTSNTANSTIYVKKSNSRTKFIEELKATKKDNVEQVARKYAKSSECLCNNASPLSSSSSSPSSTATTTSATVATTHLQINTQRNRNELAVPSSPAALKKASDRLKKKDVCSSAEDLNIADLVIPDEEEERLLKELGWEPDDAFDQWLTDDELQSEKLKLNFHHHSNNATIQSTSNSNNNNNNNNNC